jgi:tetratricopeptide (TPR) repeat protein
MAFSCIICLESDPPPIWSGCGCRSDGGLAHVACLIEKAVAQQPHRGYAVWQNCQTCKQDFTGAMQLGLAEAWMSRVCNQAEESHERLGAAYYLGECRLCQGHYAEAERIYRQLVSVSTRVLGEDHSSTLASAGNLASSLSYQLKHAEAERIYRQLVSVQRRVLGDEHRDTLTSAGGLAAALWSQRKYVDAERINREVLEARKRALGEEHVDTLSSAHNLAAALAGQRKYAEAEQMDREVLAVRKRVLGPEHPDTLGTASNLAITLLHQCKHAEAQQMFEATLEARRRVLGAAHPDTLDAAAWLREVRSSMRATQPAAAAGKAAYGAAWPLPVDARVLVQRLVAKPEHNGKRARVLSFDARTGRYAVALDGGKELSLKPECVARAGCAAVGCTAEEASSVCARCQEVRYCSRECQRADWKTHKLACTARAPTAP